MKRRDLLKFLAVAPLVKYVPITEVFDSLFAAPVTFATNIGGWVSYKVKFITTLPPTISGARRLRFVQE